MKKISCFSFAFALFLSLSCGCSSSDGSQIFREVQLSDNVAHAQSICYSFDEAVVDVEDSVAEYVFALSMQTADDAVPFVGTEYIRSTDLDEIVEQTPYVVKVTVGNFFGSRR